ncbi:MAG: methenyltetrahydromethanopterin cyclohydrolase [Planctomycetaceae bacterium]|nr:methenyltetrahydromethanopterin cyclohydrolase [Planctomycetaceae bacterium]
MGEPGLLLNDRAWQLAETLLATIEDLRGCEHQLSNGCRLIDMGVDVAGGLDAGIALARLCLADLGRVTIGPGPLPADGWPHVQVTTDAPVAACLASQYAGWQISEGDYFGMGSGPMRAAAAHEKLFEDIQGAESAQVCVGVLESARLPDEAVVDAIAEKTRVGADRTLLAVAPTASQAGTVQVVARSVETALHKLHELKFDVSRVVSGFGSAPLPPVAADDLAGIGRTNDAILYGGHVTLWVTGDDNSLAEIVPRVPSSASDAHGRPFLEIFAGAGHDFYQIDPYLFSPAVITLMNVDSGRVHRHGHVSPEILSESFGL